MPADSVFAGVNVLDAASFLAGPAAAAVLADFGAQVIKIEPPAGDLSRLLSSVPPSPRATANYSWELTNRNKRGRRDRPQGARVRRRSSARSSSGPTW